MDIKEVILDCTKKIMKENNCDITPTDEMLISRDNGIDSLGMVTLIMEMEEALGVELDDYLAEVRSSKTIGELIGVVGKAVVPV